MNYIDTNSEERKPDEFGKGDESPDSEFIIDYLNRYGDGVFEVCENCIDNTHTRLSSQIPSKHEKEEQSSQDTHPEPNGRSGL